VREFGSDAGNKERSVRVMDKILELFIRINRRSFHSLYYVLYVYNFHYSLKSQYSNTYWTSHVLLFILQNLQKILVCFEPS
jgi:hypothetical protein